MYNTIFKCPPTPYIKITLNVKIDWCTYIHISVWIKLPGQFLHLGLFLYITCVFEDIWWRYMKIQIRRYMDIYEDIQIHSFEDIWICAIWINTQTSGIHSMTLWPMANLELQVCWWQLFYQPGTEALGLWGFYLQARGDIIIQLSFCCKWERAKISNVPKLHLPSKVLNALSSGFVDCSLKQEMYNCC